MRHLHIFLAALSKGANTLAEWALMLCGFGMVAVISTQVFCRYVLNDSLFWSEELGRLLLVWLTFIGASVAYKRGAHIGVDLVTNQLPAMPKRLAAILAHMVCLCSFAAMTFYGYKFLGILKFQSTTSLGVSKQIPFLMVPVSSALLFLHGLVFLLDAVNGDDKT